MESIAKANAYIAEHRQEVNPRFREVFHAMPPLNWCNDPNGFVFYQGEFHLFYQFYPYKNQWGPMHWGHASSPDLVTWKDHGVALAPEGAKESGCWSGSSLVNPNDPHELLVYYTRHFETAYERVESIVLAHSFDGENFTRVAEVLGPKSVPLGYSTADFRDPKIVYRDGLYYLLVASTKNGQGTILIFKGLSPTKFDFFFAIALPQMGLVAECPDYARIGSRDLVMFSAVYAGGGHQSCYAFGTIDWDKGGFESEGVHRLDFGTSFYASQCVFDLTHRFLITGWLENWNKSYPLILGGDNWSGGFAFPRSCLYHEGRLIQKPAAELEEYLGSEVPLTSKPFFPRRVLLQTSLAEGESLEFYSSSDPSDRILISNEEGVISVDESHELLGKGARSASDFVGEGPLTISCLIDTSSLELFLPDGECGSYRYYFLGKELGFHGPHPATLREFR